MEDDDVDVLGDFNLGNLEDGRLSSCYDGGFLGSQNSELLQCDYNIHSNWMLDAPSTHSWYLTDDPKSFNGDERHHLSFCSSMSNPASNSSVQDHSDANIWTDKEKSLLERGIELFGKRWMHLSQFIGTKTAQQVKTFVMSENFSLLGLSSMQSCAGMSTAHSDSNMFSVSELIDDMQIPASIEEVITVVSTAKPTVNTSGKCNTSSRLKENCKTSPKKKNFHSSISVKNKGRKEKVQVKRKVFGIKKDSGSCELTIKSNKHEQFDKWNQKPLLITKGEEVVRMKKEESSESDEEIEVDDNSESEICSSISMNLQQKQLTSDSCEKLMDPVLDLGVVHDEAACSNANKVIVKENSHQETMDKIFLLPSPTREINLDLSTISEEEKGIHVEFFEERPTKTPKRYLKIRNHILECWRTHRPAYVTKTFVRSGLKNCGDVNCIGRIHAYLEKVGAINFGAARPDAVRSVRPTTALNNESITSNQDTSGCTEITKKDSVLQTRKDSMRLRKKKLPFDADWVVAECGGYTIPHDADGTPMPELIIKGSKKVSKSRQTGTVKLIDCCTYSSTKPAPFSVCLQVCALIVMDVHAHSFHTEVAGLLGGHYDPEKQLLQICQAFPCRSNSSGIHCDVCPVSQSEASEKLQKEGLEVVGWYHSHPTFEPNPSTQDVDTQVSMQQWLTQSSNSPLVSIIISPYGSPLRVAAQFRCITIDQEDDKPYEHDVKLNSDYLESDFIQKHITQIFDLASEKPELIIDFDSNYCSLTSSTCESKCLGSVRHHLNACDPSVPEYLNKTVAQTVSDFCTILKTVKMSSQAT